MNAHALSPEAFKSIVRDTPLVSLDLVVRNNAGEILLGLRTNKPAQNSWFVPGGRINKNETLDAAFERLTAVELGCALARREASFVGVYEHFYADSAVDDAISTHYVVLAFSLIWTGDLMHLPKSQHSAYRWLTPGAMAMDMTVHANSRAYAQAFV